MKLVGGAAPFINLHRVKAQAADPPADRIDEFQGDIDAFTAHCDMGLHGPTGIPGIAMPGCAP